jgi:hypothetical protein
MPLIVGSLAEILEATAQEAAQEGTIRIDNLYDWSEDAVSRTITHVTYGPHDSIYKANLVMQQSLYVVRCDTQSTRQAHAPFSFLSMIGKYLPFIQYLPLAMIKRVNAARKDLLMVDELIGAAHAAGDEFQPSTLCESLVQASDSDADGMSDEEVRALRPRGGPADHRSDQVEPDRSRNWRE